jgi:hypothetical protein
MRTEITRLTTPERDAKAREPAVPEGVALSTRFERVVILRLSDQTELAAARLDLPGAGGLPFPVGLSMAKKWYSFFISVGGQPEAEADAPSAEVARTVAEIAATVSPPPTLTKPVADPTSFTEIYEAAEIRAPAHGYTILKLAEMLRSEHIRHMPREVKRSSLLVALEAAGARVEDVIQDAVRRDQALDAFERVRQRAAEQFEADKTKENEQLQAELDRLAAEYRARIQANLDAVAKQRERFFGWRLQKQEEERKIADAVSYFVSENPITTPAPPAAGGQ